jgi:hypothetical protein
MEIKNKQNTTELDLAVHTINYFRQFYCLQIQNQEVFCTEGPIFSKLSLVFSKSFPKLKMAEQLASPSGLFVGVKIVIC